MNFDEQVGSMGHESFRAVPFTKPILDTDSSVSETYGHQEGTAYNGYFA
jgi:hypothetical protein